MSRSFKRRIFSRIGVRLGLGFVVLLLIMASLAFYSSYRGREALKESVGTASEAIAESLSTSVDRLVYQRGHEVVTILTGYDVISFASSSNEAYGAMPDPQDYIDDTDAEWISASEEEIPSSMQEILENDLSHRLRVEFVEHYFEEHGTYVFGEILVTNEYGAVIASTHRPVDFRQDDEAWWQSAQDREMHFTDIVAGENSGVYGVWACIPLIDDDDSLVGVARATVNFLAIMKEVELTALGYETSELRVATSDGQLIYSSRAYVMFEDVSSNDFFTAATQERGHFTERESDTDRLFSYVHSTGYLDYEGSAWLMFLSYSEAEVLAPASYLETQILAGAASALLLALAVSIILSRSVTVPIAALTDAARGMAGGNLENRVNVVRQDELGELGDSFNDMAGELSLMYSRMDALVKERTKELENANRKLSILGSITRHDALNQLTVQKGWLGMASESVADQETAGYLKKIDDAAENLVAFLQFTSDYERVGLTKPEWIGLEEAYTTATMGLSLGEVVVDANLPRIEVYADPMFPKVLHNLIGNSLKHGEKVSRISISCSQVPEGMIIIYEDDGVGIPEASKGGLFERDGRKSGRSHGLFLSAEILKITGISITETGVPGKGARFEVTVPNGRFRASE